MRMKRGFPSWRREYDCFVCGKRPDLEPRLHPMGWSSYFPVVRRRQEARGICPEPRAHLFPAWEFRQGEGGRPAVGLRLPFGEGRGDAAAVPTTLASASTWCSTPRCCSIPRITRQWPRSARSRARKLHLRLPFLRQCPGAHRALKRPPRQQAAGGNVRPRRGSADSRFENLYGIGPEGFVSLIANASLVLTKLVPRKRLLRLFRKPFRVSPPTRAGRG